MIPLRLLTTELCRRQVRTWTIVIRVISRELDNPLVSIASLAQFATEPLCRGRAKQVLGRQAMIEERARHQDGFIPWKGLLPFFRHRGAWLERR